LYCYVPAQREREREAAGTGEAGIDGGRRVVVVVGRGDAVRQGGEGAGGAEGAGELPLLRRRGGGHGRGGQVGALLPAALPQDQAEVRLHRLRQAPRHLPGHSP